MSYFSNYLRALETGFFGGKATEHTYRPALEALIETIAPEIDAINEPGHVDCGAPDYAVYRKSGAGNLVVGYIETKDIGASLDQVERSEQLQRYRSALPSLILTDYLEFRWYVDGELRRTARLAKSDRGNKLARLKDGIAGVEELLRDFLAHTSEPVSTPKELAERLARLAHLIHDTITAAFEGERASQNLQSWRKAFAQVLVADLDQPEKLDQFADMFAQTLAYGLFSARVMDDSTDFSLFEAQHLIPKTNPFLRDFFFHITGPQMDDEPFAAYVNDLVALLANTDMAAVLQDFGKRTRQEDPTVHFYETFLAAYDPGLRERRGVYYTPTPVVSYIVRSVDHLLKKRFNLPNGLADTSTITVPDPDLNTRGKSKKQHKTLILDPAAGTGTFLYSVIDHIRQGYMEAGNAGMWSGYVRQHLLPRLFGFELLMAPYAVAHFKLAMQLAGLDLEEAQRRTWAYDFASGERLNIFLTNTLEQPHEWTGLPLFTRFLADETEQANQIKGDLPIMVILGNPPYSGHSSNQGKIIRELVQDYYFVDGKPLGERNTKWLQDDYVKFIRWSQDKLERTGYGILAFITNHGYLDNPTFRGMRQHLMQTFDEIYVLDLHGSSLKQETSPDECRDENVFDIQQGVAIGIFVKYKQDGQKKTIYHADLWGSRESKYEQLTSYDINTIEWQQLKPAKPFFLFIPLDRDLLQEYQQGWKITDIFNIHSMGVTTARDSFTIEYENETLWKKLDDFIKLPIEEARLKYQLGDDARDWSVEGAQVDLVNSGPKRDLIRPISYRPFDTRYAYYTGKSRGIICMPRQGVMQHLTNKQQNLALCFIRRSRKGNVNNYLVARNLVDKNIISSVDNANIAPLYIFYQEFQSQRKLIPNIDNGKPGLDQNFTSTFLEYIKTQLSLSLHETSKRDLLKEIDPEDIFHYIYAILYSPTYRSRYAEFLKIDFPRIPVTSDLALFRSLCALGGELVALHLLETPVVGNFITRYPVPGENRIERGYPKYVQKDWRVHINKTQYFEGVPPQVWEFLIGGYQVLHKWLKDRRGRLLTFDDLNHYQKVVVALTETIRLMDEIDDAIPEWPIT